MMSGEAFTPGFRFKNGRLYVFTTETVMVIQGWSDPSAFWKKRAAGAWTPFIPEFRLVRPYRRPADRRKTASIQLPLFSANDLGPRRLTIAQQRERAFTSFRFSLPKQVAETLQRFQSDQWEPIMMMHDWGEAAVDLFNSNPALAFCLANHCRFRSGLTRPSRLPDGMVHAKQREIMHWLGLPDSNAAVGILRKMAPESVTAIPLARLRETLTDTTTMKLLGHVRAVNAGVMAVVGDTTLRHMICPSLLDEVATDLQQKYRARTAALLGETTRMHQALAPTDPAPQFRSLAELHEVHGRLTVEYLRRQAPSSSSRSFPRPPVRGTADIAPIVNSADLAREGSVQHNCVASYANRVLNGTTYIYQVLRPERATLSIVRTPRGSWVRDQLLKRAMSASVQRPQKWWTIGC